MGTGRGMMREEEEEEEEEVGKHNAPSGKFIQGGK